MRGLTVSGLRRFVLYQPIAVMTAILLLPALSWVEPGQGPRPFQAAAQISGYCNPSPANAVLRVDCPATTPIANLGGDLYQFEQDAVKAYLGMHKLPDTDAHIIYDYGRKDLRDAIRASMISLLMDAAATPPASLTAHQVNLLQWFRPLVQQNEIALYTSAQNEYNRWASDPCTFTLDPAVASASNLSYDAAPFCFANIQSLLGQPPVPAASYYTAYGMKNSYGQAASTYPDFANSVADTASNLGEIAGIAWGAGGVVAAAASASLIASLASALTAFNTAVVTTNTTVSAALFSAEANAAFVVGGDAVAELGLFTTALGPVAIVMMAAAVGVEALMSLLNDQANAQAIANFLANLNQAKTTPPDLNAFAHDSSGAGMYKFQATLVTQTEPEMASTATLPTHQATDLNFAIASSPGGTPSVTSTLTYRDWNGVSWSAQTSGGWFVQTCTSSAANCPQTDSIIASIRYVDWSGVNWTASRIGDKFNSTKSQPASTDVPCPADSQTEVSPASDFSNCGSYVSSSIPLTDDNGNHVIVGFSVLSAPAITSSATMKFSPGTPSTQTITAVGNPTPTVCLKTGALTSDFTMNGGNNCGTGSYTIEFDGTLNTPDQVYNLTFTASNGIGTAATQNVAVNVSQQLNIISPSTLTGIAGEPVNFTVIATGNPTPSLSAGTEGLLGLNFKDNGNGTATISGTVSFAQENLCINPCSSGVTATNSQGTVTQWIQIDMLNPPPAIMLPPTSAKFIAGVTNSILLNSTGAVTPVKWQMKPDPNAATPWLTLHDNGDGSALLTGTPPVGTSGTFSPFIGPGAFGMLAVILPFPITVENIPEFLSPNTATFAVGTQSSFAIVTNQGTVSLLNSLPKGLSFFSGNTPLITGNPAAGAGGQYTVTLNDDAGTAGSTAQSLNLNVYEAPRITSSNTATFFTGTPGSFAVTTTGFPSLSATPVKANALPPTSATQGEGMYFTVTGLPADLRFSNLNPLGLATGTLTIQGTPSAADAGVHLVQITAQNGVGSPAQQTLTLNIVQITGPAPTSGSTCNGNYNGTFHGNLTVSPGQNCAFVGGGGVSGNVNVNGGNLALAGANIGGNLSIQGAAGFSLGPGTTISGNLAIQNVASGSANNRICDTKTGGNLQVSGNAVPITVGSTDNSCAGNSFDGSVTIDSNTAATRVYNNSVGKNLSCTGNTAITGGGNSAQKKNGQCSAF
jgi:hypothetical protein